MRTLLRSFVMCAVIFTFTAAPFNSAAADGDHDDQKVIVVKLTLGMDGDKKRRFHPAKLNFERSKRYRLVISNPSLEVHEFDSPGFVEAVWSSHVNVRDGYEKGAQTVATIVGTPAEIEIVPGGSVEWEFVPVAAGQYEMVCDTKDQAGKTHTASGMRGTILVK